MCLEERAAQLYASKHNQEAWIRAVRRVMDTTNGWLLSEQNKVKKNPVVSVLHRRRQKTLEF